MGSLELSCLLTQGLVFGLGFVCVTVAIPVIVFLLCVAVAIPATVFSLPLLLSKEFWSGMGSDGFSDLQIPFRWRCRRCYTNIPAGLRGKYGQAVAARTGELSTGSSTSSGEEERKSKSQEAEIKSFGPKLITIGSGGEKKRREGKAFHSTLERKLNGGRVENGLCG